MDGLQRWISNAQDINLERWGIPKVPGNTCEELRPLCEGNLYREFRTVCPVTCGCSDPTSGILMTGTNGGCPMACQDEEVYATALAETACEDLTPAAAANDSRWQQWAKEWTAGLTQAYLEYPQNLALACPPDGDCVSYFLQKGCDIVPTWHTSSTTWIG